MILLRVVIKDIKDFPKGSYLIPAFELIAPRVNDAVPLVIQIMQHKDIEPLVYFREMMVNLIK